MNRRSLPSTAEAVVAALLDRSPARSPSAQLPKKREVIRSVSCSAFDFEKAALAAVAAAQEAIQVEATTSTTELTKSTTAMQEETRRRDDGNAPAPAAAPAPSVECPCPEAEAAATEIPELADHPSALASWVASALETRVAESEKLRALEVSSGGVSKKKTRRRSVSFCSSCSTTTTLSNATPEKREAAPAFGPLARSFSSSSSLASHQDQLAALAAAAAAASEKADAGSFAAASASEKTNVRTFASPLPLDDALGSPPPTAAPSAFSPWPPTPPSSPSPARASSDDFFAANDDGRNGRDDAVGDDGGRDRDSHRRGKAPSLHPTRPVLSTPYARPREHLTPFHAASPAPISLSEYAERLAAHLRPSPLAFAHALELLDRLSKSDPLASPAPDTAHRLLLASVAVAAKLTDDRVRRADVVARVGGVPASELADLELALLRGVGFRAHVPRGELLERVRELKRVVSEKKMAEGDGKSAGEAAADGDGRASV